MKKKNGFTLVELLAVIIIMALIAGIIIPNVLNIIDKSEKKTFREAAKSIIRSADNFLADNDYEIEDGKCYDIKDGNIELKEGTNIKDGEFCVIDSQPFLKHITDGELCASGDINSLDVYQCGTKSVVTFSGKLLEENTTPHVVVPDVAFVVKNGDKLDNYIKDYNKTYNGINTYDFWPELNVNIFNSSWDKSFNNSTIINSDIIINGKTFQQKNIYNGELTDGKYYIQFYGNQAYTFGYNSDNNSELVLLKKDLRIYRIEKYSDGNYTIFKPDNKVVNIRTSWYQVNCSLIFYTNSYGANQRFNIVPYGDGSYQFKVVGNDSLCMGFSETSYSVDNQLKLVDCSDSKDQRFVFIKA